MTAIQTIVVLVACAGGAALQATAGFGFALLAAPVLVRALGPAEAIGVLGVLSILVNVLTLAGTASRAKAGRAPNPRSAAGSDASPSGVLVGELLRLAPPAAAGLIIGALLLGIVPDAVLQAVLAAAVLAALVTRGGAPPTVVPPRRAWRMLTGAGAGLMTTTIGVNGPPLVLWLRARGATASQLRATLATAFLAAGAATVLVLALLGDLHVDPITVVIAAVAVGAGHSAGHRRATAMAVRRHEQLVTVVLVLSAVGAAVSAIPI